MDLISFHHSFNDLFFFGGYIITLNYFFLFYVEMLLVIGFTGSSIRNLKQDEMDEPRLDDTRSL
jgi:uncharacterized membrane protein